MDYLPHIDLLLRTMRITRDRLDSRSKVAIETPFLRMLLRTLAEQLPFSETFYVATYPDLRAAHTAGAITDLHRHFCELGYFEGRLGSPPAVDEAFYLARNPDVASAVEGGAFGSATDHYIRAGAAEGRMPNPEIGMAMAQWAPVLAGPPGGSDG